MKTTNRNGGKSSKQLIAKIRRELIASDKREESERRLQDSLRAELATVIAEQRGLVIGGMYYVLPTPGQKFRGEIIKFDRHWSQSKRRRPYQRTREVLQPQRRI